MTTHKMVDQLETAARLAFEGLGVIARPDETSRTRLESILCKIEACVFDARLELGPPLDPPDPCADCDAVLEDGSCWAAASGADCIRDL